MTKDGTTPRVVNADNTTSTTTIVQFNPASQLPIKLSGSHNFTTWKAQFSMLMHGHDLYGQLDGSTLIPTPSTTFGTNKLPTLLIHFGSVRINSSRMPLWRLLTRPLPPQLLLPAHPKMLGDSLHTAYANKSQTRIFSLRDQLARITKDTIPITEYLHVFGPFQMNLLLHVPRSLTPNLSSKS